MSNTNTTTVAAMKELMAGWTKIESAAKVQYPKATKEELYRISKSAMNQSLGIK